MVGYDGLEDSKQLLQHGTGNKPLPQQNNKNSNSSVAESYESTNKYLIELLINKQS